MNPAPTGLWPPAQGCEARATLGERSQVETNPNGVAANRARSVHVTTPLGLMENWNTMFSQGRRVAPTLGFGTMPRWGIADQKRQPQRQPFGPARLSGALKADLHPEPFRPELHGSPARSPNSFPNTHQAPPQIKRPCFLITKPQNIRVG